MKDQGWFWVSRCEGSKVGDSTRCESQGGSEDNDEVHGGGEGQSIRTVLVWSTGGRKGGEARLDLRMDEKILSQVVLYNNYEKYNGHAQCIEIMLILLVNGNLFINGEICWQCWPFLTWYFWTIVPRKYQCPFLYRLKIILNIIRLHDDVSHAYRFLGLTAQWIWLYTHFLHCCVWGDM